MTAYVDTSVLVRHLTGDPPEQAAAATRYLAAADELLLEDLIVAEIAYVLESVYKAARADIALSLRGILGFRAIRTADPELLQRAVEIYDVHRLDFAEAYLVASAERAGVSAIASFDRSIDRVRSVQRVEPD